MFLSKRAKVTSDKPAYTSKIKTPSGFKFVYSPKALSKRVKEKHHKLELLRKDLGKLMKRVDKDLGDEDLRTKAIAAVVSFIEQTGLRVGNEESVKDHKTFGATTLLVKHLKFRGSKVMLRFKGKKQVDQEHVVSGAKLIKVLRELVKGKKPTARVFEVDGKVIWDRAVNRYLAPFQVSAKDIRGFKANDLMKDALKHMDWKEALEEVAEEIGHTPNVLKNDYLDPALVKKHESKVSKAGLLDDTINGIKKLLTPGQQPTPQMKDYITRFMGSLKGQHIKPSVKTNSLILNAWEALMPLLPSSAMMTSGERNTEDQIRIINNYWRISGASKDHPDETDPYKMSRLLKGYGYIVGPPTTSAQYGHLKGNALDVSGADLNEIAKAVSLVNAHPELGVRFGPPLIEPANNAVHVNILSSNFNPQALAALLEKRTMTASVKPALSKRAQEEGTEDETPDDLDEVLEAFLSSNPPEDLVQEVGGLFARAAKELEIFTSFPKTCGCGIVYATLDDFLKLPFKKQPPTSNIVPDDAGLGCYTDIADYDLLHRDCTCLSTLVLKVSCIHGKEQKAVDTITLNPASRSIPLDTSATKAPVSPDEEAKLRRWNSTDVLPTIGVPKSKKSPNAPEADDLEGRARIEAITKPGAFLTYLVSYYPQFERMAVEHLVKLDPYTYFLLQYHNDPRHQDLAIKALEYLIESRPDAFFNLELFLDPAFKSYLTRAMLRLLATEPQRYFGNLHLYDYPVFAMYNKAAAFAVASKSPAFFLESVLPYFPEFHSLKTLAETKAGIKPPTDEAPTKPKTIAPAKLHKKPGNLDNYMVFSAFKLHEKDPDKYRILARMMADAGNLDFLRFKLQKTYPDLTPLLVQALKNTKSSKERLKLESKYPELKGKLLGFFEESTYKPALSKRAGIYGYWLSPSGRLHGVHGQTGHWDFLVEHPEWFDLSGVREGDYTPAFERGWIRLVTGSELNVEAIGQDGNEVIRRIQDVLPSIPSAHKVTIDLSGVLYSVTVPFQVLVEASEYSDLLEHDLSPSTR
jgi:hypothetical protein